MLVRLYSLDRNGLCVEVRTIQDSSRKVAGATSYSVRGLERAWGNGEQNYLLYLVSKVTFLFC